MTITISRRRSAPALAALGLAVALGACSDLLSVENPGAIQDEQLNDITLAPALVQSSVADFQRIYDDLAYYSAVITDEAVTGHNFETIKEIDLRLAKPNNGTINGDIYTPLQRARFSGDSISGRLRVIYADSAASSIGLARTLTYAGYGNMLLGEFMCSAPVDPTSASISWDELMQRGLDRFDEAITVATASKQANPSSSAAADSLIALAHVGAARAAINVGDMSTAIGHASRVPASIEFRVPFATDKSYLENTFYGATHGNNRNLGVDAAFRGLNDTRVRHSATSRTGHNGLTLLWTPSQSPSFGEWVPTKDVEFGKTTSMRFASGLEARYIVAEAQGPTQATVDFINERRLVGNPAASAIALSLGADGIMAELRSQRSRDFFLDGHRLGDLRRYKKLYSIDLFPAGPHPNAEWGNYGSNECFLLPIEETTGNPNAKG